MLKDHKNEAIAALTGIGVGASIMYLLDPQRGKSRRKLRADMTAAALRDAREQAVETQHRIRNRMRGAYADLRAAARHEDISDPQLAEHVRAELGRHTSGSLRRVAVQAEDGHVTLTGEAPPERAEIVRAARAVRGVDDVTDEMHEPSQTP
jgi:osmotically-inducible protein OsmY